MRTIATEEITRNIKEMCIEANHFLSADMEQAMKRAAQTEESPLGKQILGQLQDNLEIAGKNMIPICQDTGMAVVFLEVGQDVHFEGRGLTDAVNEGVRQGYTSGYLRKSVVGDPLIRENTKDNTPAVIHTEIVTGGSGEDYGSAERLWQREHEQSVYAETCRRDRRSEGCNFDGGEGRRPQCLSAHGGRCRNRRHF